MAFTAVDLFGTVGLLVLLSAFAANAFGRLSHASRLYQGMNAVGSGILAVYAWAIEAWVFLPLEVVWAGVATFMLARNLAGATPPVPPKPT